MANDQHSRPSRRKALQLVTGAAAASALASSGAGRASAATVYRTPSVYVEEENAIPNSVVVAATAVPAFIGFTERAENRGKSLRNKPWRITSWPEFRRYFGAGPTARIAVAALPKNSPEAADFRVGDQGYELTQTTQRYFLYHGLRLFFANGGGPCYIVSIGGYDDDVRAEAFKSGLDRLLEETEPTLLVAPDAMLLPQAEAAGLQQAMLAHCGTTRNRFAILDVWNGFADRGGASRARGEDPIDGFRKSIGVAHLAYGAAYYPWLHAHALDSSEMGSANLDDFDSLRALIEDEPGTESEVTARSKILDALKAKQAETPDQQTASQLLALDRDLGAASPLYLTLLEAMRGHPNLLPPSAAIAGIYARVDNTRGVWKAPANARLQGVISPSVEITHDQQEDFNAPLDGKAVNTIRSFPGKGPLVWGARTLDGNSQEWRYVAVRRTMIMIEESIKLATKAYVFEPNDANTWAAIKGMIGNFLTDIWKIGGLAGASAEGAFSVHVGLGETMTAVDILEGLLRVTALVAPTRPAEFIEISFQQQMQKS